MRCTINASNDKNKAAQAAQEELKEANEQLSGSSPKMMMKPLSPPDMHLLSPTNAEFSGSLKGGVNEDVNISDSASFATA